MLLWLLAMRIGMGTAMAMRNAARNVHFNNAGDSPSPPAVTNAILKHLELESRVGGYRAAELAGSDGVYASAARLIGAGRRRDGDGDDGGIDGGEYDARDEIALVESATVGWTRFFYSALETRERESSSRAGREEGGGRKEERIVLVSEAEYAANLVAAVKFARDRNKQNSGFRWRVLPIPSRATEGEGGMSVSSGVVDLEAFRSILEGTYAIGGSGGEILDPAAIVMVCITHVPTNAGIINPVNEIGSAIDQFNSGGGGDELDDAKLPRIIYLVDACQSVGQLSVDVRSMRCHALAATGRKYLRGPRGTGFLYVRRRVANALEPSHVDHAAAPVAGTVGPSSRGLEEDGGLGLRHAYRPGAARFEFWEASAACRLGLGAAMDGALAAGADAIEGRCAELGGLLRRRLRAMGGVRVHHDESSACGIVTFFSEGTDATSIKERMQDGFRGGDFGNAEDPPCRFHLSVVPATSTPLDSSLGERSLVRASVSYFNTEDEIELFCKALETIVGGM